MRRTPIGTLVTAVLLLLVPAGAPARAASPPDPATVSAALAGVRTAGTTWGLDPATGRVTLGVDDTVGAADLAVLRATAERAGALLRREPGRLRPLIAAGQAIHGSGGARCSLGLNARRGTTWYAVTAGHCTATATTWYADSARTSPLGPRVATSFPGDDYGLIQHTGGLPHPGAIHTYPGQLPVAGTGTALVGQAVCRSGATTGVRCGTVTALNQTVNYAQGSVSGLIRTNICAESGDSGGPLYVAATGVVLGILSGGSGNCTSGGSTYYQPINEILAAYGLTVR
ncbi:MULTISPECIES: S1 family peptidase [Micromonospora]|uniref:Trypsin n=1 Tax=Micromonospora yangpuensis TaxID=683228 RepID=A0A1C6UNX4_9ACTN|nr:S1 family peptidase [Micromonospora yangpuensis]GGM09135.1 serine protease [Micromonospora yangpuensis]SCL55623.1 Trypsin [Micromonospora yangpuensis]